MTDRLTVGGGSSLMASAVRDGKTRPALWSADYGQITGQALVTSRVVRPQSGMAWREYVYRGTGWRSLVTWAGAVSRLWRDIALGRTKLLYLVCSRSTGGFLRDVPALLAARMGVRTVVHAHGSDITDLLSSRRLSPLARALYARCEIIVPSAHLLQPLRTLTPSQVHLCENYFIGADTGTDPLSRSAPGMFTVLWNSNIMASKGFFDLVEAVRELKGKGLSVRLLSMGIVLGDNEMRVLDAARRLDSLLPEDWFDYRGRLEPDVAAALVGEADVVCLPSRYASECQPLALIQAMCAGKAVVASDTPALQATLRDYPASLVPVRSAGALTEALATLYGEWQADHTTYASRRKEAAARARTRFSPAGFDRTMATILERQ